MTNRLILKREALADLAIDELERVAGARPTGAACATETCTQGCTATATNDCTGSMLSCFNCLSVMCG